MFTLPGNNNTTQSATAAIAEASSLALRNGNQEADSCHLALSLLSKQDGILYKAIAYSGNGGGDELVKSVERLLHQEIKKTPPSSTSEEVPKHTDSPKGVISRARLQQVFTENTCLDVNHLLYGLLMDSSIQRLLNDAGVFKSKRREGTRNTSRTSAKVGHIRSQSGYNYFRALKTYGHDLVEHAGKLDPVIGRHDDIERVVSILSRRTKNNPMLIGEPGVGKTAVVEGLAQRIVKGDVPKNLADRSVVSLDMAALVAGTTYRGMFEERLKSVIKETEVANGKVILFIDEIHLLIGAGRGKDNVMDGANIMKPMLARGQVQCIGPTTLKEYAKYIENDGALERRFQKVFVAEPTVTDTISILRGLKKTYERHHAVHIQDASLVAAAQLSTRYITSRSLPDKAIDLVDEACANVRVQLDSQPKEIDILQRKRFQLESEKQSLEKEDGAASNTQLSKVEKELDNLIDKLNYRKRKYNTEKEIIAEMRNLKQTKRDQQASLQEAFKSKDIFRLAQLTEGISEVESGIARLKEGAGSKLMLTDIIEPDQIAEVVSRWTGIPVTRLGQSEKQRLLTLADRLKERVVGQDHAVIAVANAVLNSRAGLGQRRQPTGSFLFMGPTGVGKTELAKALAEQLFDDEKLLVRIDMSEYMDRVSVSRLIGEPLGNIGQLTEPVRQRPYCVLLLDEVEKADVSVLNILLQVLDDGRLTDGQGHTVDFTNTVIVMTSNLGANRLIDGLNEKCSMQSARELAMEEVQTYFKPEMLNRLDEIVVFDPLEHEQLRKIVRLQINDVASRLAEKGIALDVSDSAVEVILAKSYDQVYGARPIRRWLKQNMVIKLSKMLLKDEINENSIVHVEATPTKEELVYRYKKNEDAKNKFTGNQ